MRRLVTTGLLGLGWSGAVQAQVGTLSSAQPVGTALGAAPPLLQDRNRLGLSAGGFVLYPDLRLSSSYDNNIYLTDSNKVGDALFTINPSIDVKSDWQNHSLNISAYSIHTRYAKYHQNDTDQYQAKADGSLTIMRSWVVSASGSYGHLIQTRGTPGDEFIFGRFILYDVAQASLKIAHRVNRLTFTLSGGIDDFTYDDVRTANGTVDQRYRNHKLETAQLRIDYETDATTSLFVSASPDRYIYSHDQPRFDRSSSGVSVLAGVNTELTRLVKGEVGLGYLVQSFKQPGFASFRGFNYVANIAYTPTALTTLTLEANRTLLNSGLPQVPGVLTSRFKLTAEHELTRRVTLQVYGEHDNDRYRGIDRTDNRLYLGVSADYRLRRFVTLAPFYRYQARTSNTDLPFGHYHDHRAGLSLVLAP